MAKQKKQLLSIEDKKFLYRAYCTNTKGTSSKYYDIVVVECSKTVNSVTYTHEVLARWGKIGTRGKVEQKGDFVNLQAAITAGKSLKSSKLRRGYTDKAPPKNLWFTSMPVEQTKPEELEDSDFERFELMLRE